MVRLRRLEGRQAAASSVETMRSRTEVGHPCNSFFFLIDLNNKMRQGRAGQPNSNQAGQRSKGACIISKLDLFTCRNMHCDLLCDTEQRAVARRCVGSSVDMLSWNWQAWNPGEPLTLSCALIPTSSDGVQHLFLFLSSAMKASSSPGMIVSSC